MRSATSCFNLTLYQKNLSRFWPIWALYGLIWLFLLPISILNESRWWDSARAAQRPLQFLEGGSAGLAMALIFGLLSAMAVFSYLYNSRSAGLMHTLPLKREGLFLTNYLSGLSCFLLPNLAVFVLSLAAEALAGAVNAGSLCMWLTVQSLLCFFFYSFAVFCAMFTGHILALPAFYGILNILAAGLAYLFDALAGAFVYGYAGIPRLSEAAVWLSPALRLTYTLNLIYPGGNGVYVQFYGLHVVLLYALAGLILTGLALLVYRRRSLERAGDIVSVGWVRPVFKYGVGACAAVALGSFLYGMFLYSLPENAWTLLSFLLLCGAAGYFVAEMLLRKRFWVFRRSWKGCLVLLGCLTALVCVLEFDLTGFERRVPGSDQVASVQIGDVRSAPYDDLNYTSLNLSDPADLALVEQLHRAIVAEKDRFDQADDYGAVQLTDGLYVETSSSVSVWLDYTLNTGGRVLRRYSLPVTAADLTDPSSAASLLTRLLNDRTQVEQGYFPRWSGNARLVDAWVSNLQNPQPGSDASEASYADVYVDSAALEELLTAVRSDLAAGRLGVRYLLDDQARQENCYLSDLYLDFRTPAARNAAQNSTDEPGAETAYEGNVVCITLQKSAAETLAVLEKYGVVGGASQLVTHAELSRMEAAGAASDGGGEYTVSLPAN